MSMERTSPISQLSAFAAKRTASGHPPKPQEIHAEAERLGVKPDGFVYKDGKVFTVEATTAGTKEAATKLSGGAAGSTKKERARTAEQEAAASPKNLALEKGFQVSSNPNNAPGHYTMQVSGAVGWNNPDVFNQYIQVGGVLKQTSGF